MQTKPRYVTRQSIDAVISTSLRFVAFLFVGLAFCVHVIADDWPGWLGSDRDGRWHEDGILERFPEGGPALRWSTKIGGGYSGPAVCDGRVYVVDWIGSKVDGSPKLLHEGEVPKNTNFVRQLLPGRERVLCLDESNGEILWTHEYDCPYSTVATYAIGPRATPTVDGDHVYTLGAEGNLNCLRVTDGSVVWSKDYKVDYDVEVPNWGFSSPPLVDGDQLICIVGGEGSTVVSFDKHTGRERWKTLSATEPGYSAPVIRNFGDDRVLVVWDSDAVHGINSETGEVRWSVDFPSTFAMSVATPQVVDSQIFVMCFNGKCALITVTSDGDSAEITWEGGRRIGIDGVHNTPMLVDGYIYGCGNGGRYLCARQSDGEQVWSSFVPVSAKRPISWGNVFTVQMTGGGATSRFLLANDHGEVIFATLTPNGYQETSRAHLIEPTHRVGGRTLVWSHPALANRSIYLRNDREIRCYSLSADQ